MQLGQDVEVMRAIEKDLVAPRSKSRGGRR
jgi:hypothetical protein